MPRKKKSKSAPSTNGEVKASAPTKSKGKGKRKSRAAVSSATNRINSILSTLSAEGKHRALEAAATAAGFYD